MPRYGIILRLEPQQSATESIATFPIFTVTIASDLGQCLETSRCQDPLCPGEAPRESETCPGLHSRAGESEPGGSSCDSTGRSHGRGVSGKVGKASGTQSDSNRTRRAQSPNGAAKSRQKSLSFLGETKSKGANPATREPGQDAQDQGMAKSLGTEGGISGDKPWAGRSLGCTWGHKDKKSVPRATGGF